MRSSAADRARINLIAALIHDFGARIEYEHVLQVSYHRFPRPGDRVIDIGAHVGDHTARFLEIVRPAGRVIAFEPLPDVNARLVARVAGADRRPECRQFALSRTPADAAPYVRAEGSLAESGLRERIYNDPERNTAGGDDGAGRNSRSARPGARAPQPAFRQDGHQGRRTRCIVRRGGADRPASPVHLG